MTSPSPRDHRAAELLRLKHLRHFELLAEVSPLLDDPWHAARFATMSRDQLISVLLPPLHNDEAVAA
jgi:hypothetical protein